MSALSPLHRKYRERPIVSWRDPAALAICDGCGFLVNHRHLREKVQYRGGNSPEPTGLFVCATCDDVPQPYFKKQVLPPDPVPVINPRPDDQAGKSSGYGYLTTNSDNSVYLVTTVDEWDWQWLGTINSAEF